MKKRLATKNGECPNCGYQFQNNEPRMGTQKGQRGGRMMQGDQMNGQLPGNQAQPNGPMNGLQQIPGNQQHDVLSGATPNVPMNGQQQAPQR